MAVAVFDALLPTGQVLRRLILRVVQRRADATATFHAAVVQWLRVALQREATLDEKALLLPRRRVGCLRGVPGEGSAVRVRLTGLQKRPFSSTFPMFVPSLSW